MVTVFGGVPEMLDRTMEGVQVTPLNELGVTLVGPCDLALLKSPQYPPIPAANSQLLPLITRRCSRRPKPAA